MAVGMYVLYPTSIDVPYIVYIVFLVYIYIYKREERTAKIAQSIFWHYILGDVYFAHYRCLVTMETMTEIMTVVVEMTETEIDQGQKINIEIKTARSTTPVMWAWLHHKVFRLLRKIVCLMFILLETIWEYKKIALSECNLYVSHDSWRYVNLIHISLRYIQTASSGLLEENLDSAAMDMDISPIHGTEPIVEPVALQESSSSEVCAFFLFSLFSE